MKLKLTIIRIICLALALFVTLFAGQIGFAGSGKPSALKFVSSPGQSRVTLSGGSNLHDWKAYSGDLQGFITLADDYRKILHPGDTLSAKQSRCPIRMSLKIPVRSFESNIPGLSERVWRELNEEKHPHIVVKLISGVFLAKLAPNTYRFKLQGIINADGVDHKSELMVTVAHPSETRLTLEGETLVRMTDFKITPPTYMDGMVKAKDKVKVKVKWVLDLNPFGGTGKTE